MFNTVRVSGLNLAISVALDADSSSKRRVWDSVVRSRAVVLDHISARHRTLSEHDDPETKKLVARTASASQRLANLTLRGSGNEAPDRYRAMLADARVEHERADEALARRSSFFRQELARSRIGLAEVADALPSRSALVAFLGYEQAKLPGTDSGGAQNSASSSASFVSRMKANSAPYYLAFVLRAGAAGRMADVREPAWDARLAAHPTCEVKRPVRSDRTGRSSVFCNVFFHHAVDGVQNREHCTAGGVLPGGLSRAEQTVGTL